MFRQRITRLDRVPRSVINILIPIRSSDSKTHTQLIRPVMLHVGRIFYGTYDGFKDDSDDDDDDSDVLQPR